LSKICIVKLPGSCWIKGLIVDVWSSLLEFKLGRLLASYYHYRIELFADI